MAKKYDQGDQRQRELCNNDKYKQFLKALKEIDVGVPQSIYMMDNPLYISKPKPNGVITDLNDSIKVRVIPGSAINEKIADILSDLSLLNRLDGESGINFSLERILVNQKVIA